MEVTYLAESSKILSVHGYPQHNDKCKNAHITSYPIQPVHPEVFEVALEQLKSGADLTEIQERNRTMFHTRGYKSLAGVDLLSAGHRWLLRASDNRSIYRQFNRMQGIKTSTPSHINIDNWIRHGSPLYDRAIADAVFYYSPRHIREERLKLCIATPQMLDAAWQYAHCSQIILDRTFGICNRKLLLFIVMAVDEEWKGVPLAFLLFSAPTKNKQTSAGYDTAILTELLEQWKSAVTARKRQPFTVHVAITDTDLME
ncbi:uncharacterized protein PHACADRAFT_189436 [Phanerochaete carnosa HHB-10118-sp]|uniref:MULE transposase domain-containing protein n=1 Tax=Phanerochaete carnosa (strain HHB-10118-sp) TaxID=650164 RepID=K5VBM6_PHACS|nr:uncharacterized protein PHACADRAFT_189436 [Phanerochaete carnosa HHB-10118-sp]EKM60296.1 hypothetical protein PHACADRAFT_189436 [Phanerochaete carnosa HHB-10118-sp]